MTPVFICGGECQIAVVGATTVSAPHWDTLLGVPTIETTLVAPSSGAASYKFATTAGTASLKKTWPSGPGIGVGRFKVMQSSRASAQMRLLILGGPANPAFIRVETSGQLTITMGASTQSGPTIALNVWALIDFRITYNSTTYTLEWTVDGVGQTDVTLAGQSSGNVGNFEIGVPNTAVTTTVYIDDIVLSNTSGDYPIGDGKTLAFVPTSDGTHTATGTNFLHNAAGTAITSATTDVWTLVDELPLGGGSDFANQQTLSTAQYVETIFGTTTEPYPPRGVEVVVARHEAATGTCSAVFKLYDSVGATEDTVLTYTTAAGVVALRYSTKQYAARPAALGAWTVETFNGLRFRFGYSGDATPDVYWDGVVLEAEFPFWVPYRNPMPPLIAQ